MKLPDFGGIDFDFNVGFMHTTPMKEAINNPGEPKRHTNLTPAEKGKVAYVMREYAHDKLRTSAGTRPKSRAQAAAIAYSEAERHPFKR